MNLKIAKSQLPAETILLLNACRSLCSNERGRLWEGVLYEGLDWNKLVQEAYEQGLAPILYHILHKNGTHEIPQTILNTLKSAYYQNMQFNLRLLNVLDKFIKAFNEIRLSIILFKGPLLANEVYTNFALRPMADIDILVKKEEMDSINKVLNKLGYKSEPVKRWLIQEYNCLDYYHKTEVKLEVHWDLLYPQDFSQKSPLLPNSILWKNAKKISIGKNHAFALSDETHLLYLCLHMAKHFMTQIHLIWACDIALFLQKKRGFIEWNYFWQLAKDSGQERLVHEALMFVEKYIGEDGTIPDLNSDFQFVSLEQNNNQDEKELRSIRILRRISSISGLWGKTNSLFEYFVPNYESIAWRYQIKDKRKVMLWRLYHPILLVWQGMEEIFQRIFKHK